MKSTTEWLGEAKFEAVGTRTDNKVLMEGPESLGGTGEGQSPMEMLLHGVAGCMSIDIKHILRHKFDDVKKLVVEVEGERQEDYPQKFVKLDINVKVDGDVPGKDVLRAAELSRDKYCSAVNSLSAEAEVHAYLNGTKL
ncbi:OsmC family protein [Aliicoccus persicus]|uniref:OsmC family protein n=1 Tax=Aliicoccus persicus TaxID=930138 RepID=A0A662Z408_9STAP|nr:OsmC family protein [Aliicoccus persicus]SEW07967.1 putative redox protein [Aliicoccus persicus]HJE19068.1 OsmC family protein [Aliicoccus persicus]